MQNSPIRFARLVRLVDIDVVGPHVQWEHGLRIEVIDSEGRIQITHRSHATANSAEKDGLIRIRHAVVNLEAFDVVVTDDVKSDHMLEALHKCSEAHSPLVLAGGRRVVTDQDCKTTLSLNLEQLLLKPGDLVAGVVPFTPNHPVVTVAAVRIVCNESGACGQLSSILQLKGHGVVAIFAELGVGLFCQPVSPILFDVVDGVVDARRGEILLIGRPRVMVALDGQNRDVSVLDRVLDDISGNFCVPRDRLSSV